MSDHYSGPRAIAGPATDITDVYVFPSPEQPARLVLVLNVHPHADQSTLFSDAITYRFRLRPLTMPATPPAAAFDVSESEWTIECTFDEPSAAREGSAVGTQRGRCVTSTGEVVSFDVNDERGGQTSGLCAFAGVRSDPFFLDRRIITDMVQNRQLCVATSGNGAGSTGSYGANSLSGANALSIVIEIERTRLPGAGSSLLAVVGETRILGKLPLLLERTGRPEIKNILLLPKGFDVVNRDLELRDLYNCEDAFHLSPHYLGAYRARLNANLAFYDGLDGKTDWPLTAEGAHPLTDLLLADFLVVDPSKPFSEGVTYEIEQALLEGRPHATCGGRPLNDHIVDRLLTWVITGGKGPPIHDGVDQATVPATRTFPCLAPCNPPAATDAHHPTPVGSVTPGHDTGRVAACWN